GGLLVASANSPQIARFGRDGLPRGHLAAALPATETVLAIAADPQGRVWLVVAQNRSWLLFRTSADATRFEPAVAADLPSAFAVTVVLPASDQGFCFDEA